MWDFSVKKNEGLLLFQQLCIRAFLIFSSPPHIHLGWARIPGPFLRGIIVIKKVSSLLGVIDRLIPPFSRYLDSEAFEISGSLEAVTTTLIQEFCHLFIFHHHGVGVWGNGYGSGGMFHDIHLLGMVHNRVLALGTSSSERVMKVCFSFGEQQSSSAPAYGGLAIFLTGLLGWEHDLDEGARKRARESIDRGEEGGGGMNKAAFPTHRNLLSGSIRHERLPRVGEKGLVCMQPDVFAPRLLAVGQIAGKHGRNHIAQCRLYHTSLRVCQARIEIGYLSWGCEQSQVQCVEGGRRLTLCPCYIADSHGLCALERARGLVCGPE